MVSPVAQKLGNFFKTEFLNSLFLTNTRYRPYPYPLSSPSPSRVGLHELSPPAQDVCYFVRLALPADIEGLITLMRCSYPLSMIHLPTVTGFLNLNKPAGLTSHDCVARVRRLLRLKRVGHAGTLDPAATGVLPIALSKATRLLQFLPQDKAYHATIRLGVTTTTDDTQGEVISSQAADHVTLDTVRSALKQFEGKIQQVPPNYSAIQVQGKRLYEMARSGEKIQVQARPVEVERIDVLAWRPGNFPELDLAIACGPGTYIRAIARDLGAALQVGGTLAALDRTYSSSFSLSDSLTFDEFEYQLQQQIFTPISPDVALAQLGAIELLADKARRWCNGQRLIVKKSVEIYNISDANGDKIVRVKHEDGRLLGIGKLSNEENNILLIPQVVIQ